VLSCCVIAEAIPAEYWLTCAIVSLIYEMESAELEEAFRILSTC